jgi:hypothetical protein
MRQLLIVLSICFLAIVTGCKKNKIQLVEATFSKVKIQIPELGVEKIVIYDKRDFVSLKWSDAKDLNSSFMLSLQTVGLDTKSENTIAMLYKKNDIKNYELISDNMHVVYPNFPAFSAEKAAYGINLETMLFIESEIDWLISLLDSGWHSGGNTGQDRCCNSVCDDGTNMTCCNACCEDPVKRCPRCCAPGYEHLVN